MNCDIDNDFAGSYADALKDGAIRFFKAHPDEKWEISGVLVQDGLSLNADNGKSYLRAALLKPVIDMAGSIYEALEAFRSKSSS